MKSCVIISGGRIDPEFAVPFVEKEQPELLIAADKGLLFCERSGILPTHIVGDFDSLGEDLLPKYEEKEIPIRRYRPEKDLTDTEIAVRLGMELGAEKITILGASEGNRLDHLFGNVMTMVHLQTAGVDCFMADAHNRVRILTKPTTIRREEQYGTYISLIPLTTEVTEVSLTGFRYPLSDYCFDVRTSGSLGISNELVEETGRIEFSSGMLLMLECMD